MTDDSSVLAVFREEARALTTALGELHAQAWDQPTRCTPWRVRDVVGHVIVVLGRVPAMVAAPAPDRPDTTATGYYRAGERFSSAANEDRVQTARNRAAAPDVATLVHDLADTWRAVVALCLVQPAARVVRTRHGDAMLLSDFLTTRVVELVVHGLDVADAVHQQPWLTPAAVEHLLQVLLGPGWHAAITAIGWDPATLLRKATGRTPINADESYRLDRLGIQRLALG